MPWTCPVCTLVNPDGAVVCGACGTARPSAPATPVNVAGNALAGMRLMPNPPTSRFCNFTNFDAKNGTRNTCWMNSVLQFIYSSEYFADIFLPSRRNLPELRGEAHLTRGLIETFDLCEKTAMSGSSNKVDPISLKKHVGRILRINTRGQSDSSSFLNNLLDIVTSETGGTPNNPRPKQWDRKLFLSLRPEEPSPPPSAVRDIFGLVSRLQYRCQVCKIYSPRPNHYNIQALLYRSGKGGIVSLLDSFADSFNSNGSTIDKNCPNCQSLQLIEKLNGDFKQWECPTCTLLNEWNQNKCLGCGTKRFEDIPEETVRTHDKEETFLNAPKVLFLNLDKSDISIGIPLVLKTLIPLLDTSAINDDSQYILTGVICHFGTRQGGHYIAKVKNPNGGWLLCDDLAPALVPIPIADFKGEMTQTAKHVVSMVYSKVLWTCGVCTFRDNPTSAKNCIQCDTVRSADSYWTCNIDDCKLQNPITTTKCLSCESWRCSTCTLVNPSTAAACGACGTPKPGAGAGGGSLAKHRKTKRRKYTKRRRVCRTRRIKKQNRS